MKRILSLLSWFVFVLGYGFLLSAGSDPARADRALVSAPDDSKEVLKGPDGKLTPLCPFAQTGGTFSCVQTASGLYRQIIQPFYTYSGIVERIFSQYFSQYTFYYKHILIRLRQTELIFPFHHFW